MLDCVLTAFTLHKAALPQNALVRTKDGEKVLPDKAVVKTEFFKFLEDMLAIIDKVRALLDGNVASANALQSERVRLLVPKENFEKQLQLKLKDSEEIESLKYRMNNACTKSHRSQTIIQSL